MLRHNNNNNATLTTSFDDFDKHYGRRDLNIESQAEIFSFYHNNNENVIKLLNAAIFVELINEST